MTRKQGSGSVPGKDYSGHHASRGRKQPQNVSLAELSKRDPTSGELTMSLWEMHNGSDRVAAILGSALVENELLHLLETRFWDEGDREALFHNKGAPLQTFSSRILISKALGLISSAMAAELNRVRAIRNMFAHALLSVDFAHPDVAAYCENLRPSDANMLSWEGEDDRELPPARVRFEKSCWHLTTTMLTIGRAEVAKVEATTKQSITLRALAQAGRDATSDQG
jgi:hypothetical protein